ncbi:MAG TPA: formate dehydrogenase accessory sulfurtransferase FdhD [Acidimicrobiales bacterium]|nr:formate dehydrogenase accessory sulfurtransferase FdhD [Acidimicrobiales bacterium]
MLRGRTNPVMVTRIRPDGGRSRRPDKVIVEEPMEIRLDDHLVATTMRTPGHDYELAVGFLFAEGLLGGFHVNEVRYCATGSAVDTAFNLVSVSTNGKAPVPQPRLGTTTSSCGLCGSTTIDELADRLEPFAEPIDIDAPIVLEVARRVRAQQELFVVTGGVHAAAAFDLGTGEVGIVREDVGRHNAVDKVVGHLHLERALPARGLGLFVSGRVSFEIVQKAWAAGFALVAGVSAPTALAVETATRANLALAGFLRDDGVNLYTS